MKRVHIKTDHHNVAGNHNNEEDTHVSREKERGCIQRNKNKNDIQLLKCFRTLEHYLRENYFQLGILYLAMIAIKCDERIKVVQIYYM